jgi:hypothetical protein
MAGKTPDWEKLARRATGYLEALATAVTPEPGQEEAAEDFDAIASALGDPPDAPGFRTEVDPANAKSIKIYKVPKGASSSRVRDAGGNIDSFRTAQSPLGLTKVDTTKSPVVVELYDGDMVLLASSVIE